MIQDLAGKVAVVTGAGRGLGRAMALALGAAGAKVVVASRTTAELDSFVSEAEAAGREALAVATDVTDLDAVEALAAQTLDHFGRVDVLINNCGVIDSAPLLEQEPEAWDRVVNTNLRGLYLTTRAIGRHLVAQRSGKVVNIASNFALMGIPNNAAYSASKGAVIAFTRSMGVEWARYNVQVNALAPGYFATALNAKSLSDPAVADRVTRAIPARRMGDADELGPWAVLLAGPASNFMTGETIVIDGGQSAR